MGHQSSLTSIYRVGYLDCACLNFQQVSLSKQCRMGYKTESVLGKELHNLNVLGFLPSFYLDAKFSTITSWEALYIIKLILHEVDRYLTNVT